MRTAVIAKKLNLTRLQLRYFSRWYCEGMTQEQIALEFNTQQERVSEVIGRALRRNPTLPLPLSAFRRRRQAA
jgi:predicted DNA-binding protein YlxM (UPF0122 family)